MRGKELLEKLTGLDPRLVQRAALSRSRAVLYRWGAMAACLVVALFVGLYWQPWRTSAPPVVSSSSEESASSQSPDPVEELPMLTIGGPMGGSMGFEGYMAYDPTELTDANPWQDDGSITTLPVYVHAPTRTENDMLLAENVDRQRMEEILLDVAARLEMDADPQAITDDAPDEERLKITSEKVGIPVDQLPPQYTMYNYVMLEDDRYKVQVDVNLVATVRWKEPESLPEDIVFTHEASEEEMAEAGEYLLERYRDLIGMEQPQMELTMGDYTYDGQQRFSLYFFEDGQTPEEKLLNYFFDRMAFYPDDEGKLYLCRIWNYDLSDCLGDYPIIPSGQALTLLEEGHFLTTVMEPFPGTEYVVRTQLVYRNGATEKTWLPYYRFLVELPGMKVDNGLNTYGAYYVPAVEERYIADMPLWDGSFN